MLGIFFDGLHGHLDSAAPLARVQPGSGRLVSSLVYDDDVVLLSWTSAGLQTFLDGMHSFCQVVDLIMSPFKTEVKIFNGTPSGMWHVGQHVAGFCKAGATWQRCSSVFECQMQGAHVQQVFSHDEALV